MAETVVNLFRKSFFVLFLGLNFAKCGANDILGCGGFVKSHVSLDFSKIEIGLYTKAGSLKERTECAPTNGYYFLPLYEKGEYVLKVHPPPGWSFEPSEVDLVVDGITDQCSTGHDINFAFNGFGITGRVITAGQSQGPSGISVQLVDDKGLKRDTVTTVGGDFHFTPVIPGKYIVKASHPRWKLEPAQAVVQVKEGNTALPVGVLAVKGYDVKGSITSYGSPISGVYVLLYSKEESPKFRVEGCNTALLQGVPDAPICHSITDNYGEFNFGLVPAGEYKLLALSTSPGQATVSYNVKPDKVQFAVHHDSLYIKNAFEVTGFTVVGAVKTHSSGAGMAGARVLSDGRAVGTTDAKGRFTLPELQPGVYTLSFQHEQCELADVQLTITASGPSSAPTAVAARWRVCGAVAPPDDRHLTISGGKGWTTGVRVAHENNGKWCTFLPSGVYSAKVDVSEQEQREGLQFYPLSQKITVAHEPVDGISFSQLKAKLTGRIQCKTAAACSSLPVTLRPLSADGGYVGQPLSTVAKDGEYTFEEVLPGSVEVSVPTDRFCWQEARHNVAVTQEIASVPTFEQTGYVIRFESSHGIEVEYTDGTSKGTLQLPATASQQCVENAAVYSLTPHGCHRFQPPQATVDTGAENMPTVHFVATAHAVVIKVLSPEPVKDLVLKVNSDDHGTKDVGPLVPLDQPSGGYLFEHTLYMAEGEISVVSAWSESLLFVPAAPQQVRGTNACQPAALTLRAIPALTLTGRLRPAVPDVTVTLTGTDDIKLTQVTTSDGTYRFGPLDASKHYTITAEKESYVFTAPDDSGDMVAHKLAEITVQLLDDADATPLQSALVSVSGGTYRRNVASGADGRLRFASLSPGEFYVKPNMKEYRFQPPHKIVKVEEGRTHPVTLRGVRVAWSCVGSLVSLGGMGWPGVTLVAVPKPGGTHCAIEEATTETSGAFRIRGLLPKCVYTLQLKSPSNPELNGLKLAKAPPTLEIKNNKDIEDVLLIAVQPTQITDVNVLIRAPNIDHYKSLRLTLALETTPHTPIYSTKLDPVGYSKFVNPGLMYVLPRLPADNKTYVLQLESSLSKSTHSYGEEVHYFNSDGRFKHYTIDFVPKVRSSEHELRQTSLLVVPLLGALVLAYLQREHLLAQLSTLAVAASSRASPRPRDPRPPRPDLLDKASIDHIVSTVNAAGKKTSKKKMT